MMDSNLLDERSLSKLRWRCRRGLLENDLFIERFFCRYLCPLGAALAIPARLRMFDWLRRYRECGSPCQRCANDCPVQAIHPEGQINVNECIYCMNCQVLYHDDTRCPHMITVKARREKLARSAGPAAASRGSGSDEGVQSTQRHRSKSPARR